MKAYLLNGVVSFVESEGAIAVNLADDISYPLTRGYAWEREFGDSSDDEGCVVGKLDIKYEEDGSVICSRVSNSGELEEVCKGQKAELISSFYFDDLETFSLENSNISIDEIRNRVNSLILENRSQEFKEGWQSFLNGQLRGECPYINPDIPEEQDKEYEWLLGFDLAKECV